jgi:hypothetical protein
MNFRYTRKIKYGELQDALLDNDAAIKLMGEFVVDEAGVPLTPEAWREVYRNFDFPDDFRAAFTQFQQDLVSPTKGAH